MVPLAGSGNYTYRLLNIIPFTVAHRQYVSCRWSGDRWTKDHNPIYIYNKSTGSFLWGRKWTLCIVQTNVWTWLTRRTSGYMLAVNVTTQSVFPCISYLHTLQSLLALSLSPFLRLQSVNNKRIRQTGSVSCTQKLQTKKNRANCGRL